MKTIKKLYKLAATGALLTAFALNFNACTERSPYAAVDNQAADSNSSLNKKAQGRGSRIYPQSTSLTLRYRSREQYGNGRMDVPSGSCFQVDTGALTPPSDTPLGADVTLTMTVDKDETNHELIFSFGPSGSQFNPAAELWFDWTDLGSRKAKLFLIDADGNYIEEQPEHEDEIGKRFMVHINHFSRYAVAWSN